VPKATGALLWPNLVCCSSVASGLLLLDSLMWCSSWCPRALLWHCCHCLPWFYHLAGGCCAMRLASGFGTGDMSLACRQLCLVHACCYAAFDPPPVPGLSQCGIWSASSVSKVGLYHYNHVRNAHQSINGDLYTRYLRIPIMGLYISYISTKIQDNIVYTNRKPILYHRSHWLCYHIPYMFITFYNQWDYIPM